MEGAKPYDSSELRRTIYEVQRLVHNGDPGFTLEDLRTIQPAQVKNSVLSERLQSVELLGEVIMSLQGNTKIHHTLALILHELPQTFMSGCIYSRGSKWAHLCRHGPDAG